MTSLSSNSHAFRPEKNNLLCRFGDRLHTLRQQQGLSTADLGKALNISKMEIERLETGALEPDLALISRISEALEVSVSELLQEL